MIAIRDQLYDWFGSKVYRWKHLRTYRIPYAYPLQTPEQVSSLERPVKVRDGLYVCGDHRDMATIHGAMKSGNRTATQILQTV